jgi:hypothetical protein
MHTANKTATPKREKMRRADAFEEKDFTQTA